ncbi:MAG: DUF309 domain-containing protein [Candidatus Handelsmanbacteria bacterium]|nr:DUF309 domain-containing protein [Candidatus Handelsmanbacteria bacterium]
MGPRYLPDLEFPPYRHLPGQTPHPRTHPQGHHFALPGPGLPLTGENWRTHRAYLAGVDLFNHAYWWEAHEAWEGPWHVSVPLYRQHLQGLVQLAAALIKWHQNNRRGMEKLAHRSRGLLQEVAQEHPCHLGIDLLDLLRRADTFFTTPPEPGKTEPAPALLIHLEL